MKQECCLEAPFVQALATVSKHEPVSSRYFLLRLKCGELTVAPRFD